MSFSSRKKTRSASPVKDKKFFDVAKDETKPAVSLVKQTADQFVVPNQTATTNLVKPVIGTG